ncbi:MAG TPA: thioredoxin-like domain-containing protein [Ohtaekwangia sp.]|nr:thioredoxin-like domain-containing protein [Ohtaekwangia sp.]
MKASLTFIIFSFGLFLATSLYGQSAGYDLEFRVDGWKDTTAYLGHYYWENTYIKDTAKVDNKGAFRFSGTKPLAPGVYFIVLDKTKIFELVIGEAQRFRMETNAADYVKNMTVTGDPDNRLFFENMNFNMERHLEAEPHIAVLKDSLASDDAKKSAREAFSKINERVVAYQNELLTKHPKTITATLLRATQPVKVPDPPKRPDGTIDSTFQLKWYRQHYFDNIDFTNEAIVRMPRPILKEKINEYLDRLYAPQPDTITKAVQTILAKAKQNQEVYKYAAWISLVKYQQPEIMGLDAVYVNIFDKYFASGEMDFWVNATMKKSLQDYADRLRKSLIGKTGPNLIMQDQNLARRALYDLKNRYTILYIFDPDCGHCKEETPKLVSFYNKNKTRFDIGVFAVSADTSMAKMKDYIKTMKMPFVTVNGPRTYVGPYQDHYDAVTTPSLFILDNRKKIIAKKIPADKLEDFFIQYEKFEKSQAGANARP